MHDTKYVKFAVDESPGIFIYAETGGRAMRAGAELVTQMIDERSTAALIGFSALLNTYKNSFRDPELKNLLKDRFTYYKWLVFTYINAAALANWDLRDLDWFRSVVGKRLENKMRVVLCMERAFKLEQLQYLFGDRLEKWIPKFQQITIGG